MAIDVMFINKITFIMSTSQIIYFGMANLLKDTRSFNKQYKHIMTGLLRCAKC